MAKIGVMQRDGTAARQLARYVQASGDHSPDAPPRGVMVLTSDGRVLWKFGTSGYSVRTRVKDAADKRPADMVALVDAYAARLGYGKVEGAK